jgi:hypothetical protein
MPLWLARFRGSDLRRALVPPVALTIVIALLVAALGGVDGLRQMFDAVAFQSDRGSQLSIWTVLGTPWLQVSVQAGALAIAVAAAVAVWRVGSLATDRARVCALAATVFLVFQLGANYWSYAYLPWVYPLLAAALLMPRAAGES